jgi:hypothetical protein
MVYDTLKYKTQLLGGRRKKIKIKLNKFFQTLSPKKMDIKSKPSVDNFISGKLEYQYSVV